MLRCNNKLIKASWQQSTAQRLVCMVASQVAQMAKNPSANAGDMRDVGVIPGSGRSPGEGNGNPLQYSCLENSMAEEPGGLQSMGWQRVKQDWVPNTFTSRCLSKRQQGFASPDSKKYTDRCMAESLRYSPGTITTLLIQNILAVKKKKRKEIHWNKEVKVPNTFGTRLFVSSHDAPNRCADVGQ